MSDKTMGRPTEERKDKRITIRISEDLYEKIYKGNISEDIREVLESSFMVQNSEREDSFVPQKEYENLKEKFITLATRVRPEAQELWNKEIYTGLVICKVGFVPQNMYEEELSRLSERLGINEYKLLEVVDYLISSGKLYRSETGLKMKGLNADPEYISVDEAIDNLDAPEWKKKSFKETILKNLDVNRFDDTGNGGGL